ncbi:unnamed protein product [Closterium sp. Yama58-4]|nr:unnamed protein product [Closterium sp. Yama58-4]
MATLRTVSFATWRQEDIHRSPITVRVTARPSNQPVSATGRAAGLRLTSRLRNGRGMVTVAGLRRPAGSFRLSDGKKSRPLVIQATGGGPSDFSGFDVSNKDQPDSRFRSADNAVNRKNLNGSNIPKIAGIAGSSGADNGFLGVSRGGDRWQGAEGVGYVHEVVFAEGDSSAMVAQFQLISTIRALPPIVPLPSRAAGGSGNGHAGTPRDERRAGTYPRMLRAVTANEGDGDGEGEGEGEGGSLAQSVQESLHMEAEWPIAWCQVAENVLIGSPLVSAADVDVVTSKAGVTAVVSLLPSEHESALAVDWSAVTRQLAREGGVALKLPVGEAAAGGKAEAGARGEGEPGEGWRGVLSEGEAGESDLEGCLEEDGEGEGGEDVVSQVLEAVRVVAALVATGHRVAIVSCSPHSASALVALGYTTFVKGADVSTALADMRRACPAADPPMRVWKKAHAQLAGSNMRRLTDLAAEELQRRIANGVPGSSANDWQVAERKLVAEGFQRMVAADVALSDAISKAAIRRAARAAEKQMDDVELTSSDRIALLKAHISRLEEKQQAADQAARAAEDRINFFLRQLSALQDKHAAAEKEAAAATQLASQLAGQLQSLQAREASSAPSSSTAAQASALGLAAAEADRVAALEAEVRERREREQELRAAQQQAEQRAASARQLLLTLEKDLARVTEGEAAAKEAAAEAKERVGFLSGVVRELEGRERDARREAERANEALEVVAARERAAQARVQELSLQVEQLEKELAAAQEASRIAHGRCDFFARLVDVLREREQAATEAAARANQALTGVARELEEVKGREMREREAWKGAVAWSEAVMAELGATKRMQREARERREAAEKLLAKLETAGESGEEGSRKLLVQARAAVAEALENEASLAGLVVALADKLTDAAAARTAQRERLAFLERQVAEGRERERAAEEAVVAAMGGQEELRRQLDEVARKEAEAREEVRVLSSKVESLSAQSTVAEEVEGSLSILRAQVAFLQSELASATQEATSATQRSTSLLHQLNLLRSGASGDGSAGQVAGSDSLEEVAGEEEMVRRLEEELSAARGAAESASQRVFLLQGQVKELQRKEGVAQALLGRAEEKMSALFGQLAAARDKDSTSLRALAKARSEVRQMAWQVARLEEQLQARGNTAGGIGLALAGSGRGEGWGLAGLLNGLSAGTLKLLGMAGVGGMGGAAGVDGRQNEPNDARLAAELSRGAAALQSRVKKHVSRLGKNAAAVDAAALSSVSDQPIEEHFTEEEEKLLASASCLREAVVAIDAKRRELGAAPLPARVPSVSRAAAAPPATVPEASASQSPSSPPAPFSSLTALFAKAAAAVGLSALLFMPLALGSHSNESPLMESLPQQQQSVDVTRPLTHYQSVQPVSLHQQQQSNSLLSLQPYNPTLQASSLQAASLQAASLPDASLQQSTQPAALQLFFDPLTLKPVQAAGTGEAYEGPSTLIPLPVLKEAEREVMSLLGQYVTVAREMKGLAAVVAPDASPEDRIQAAFLFCRQLASQSPSAPAMSRVGGGVADPTLMSRNFCASMGL